MIDNHDEPSRSPRCYVPCDHHGRPVPPDETPETVVTVWEIEPSMDSSYDYCVIRCYQDAVNYAQSVVEMLMDDPDQEYPCSVQIRQSQMTRGDLDELMNADY